MDFFVSENSKEQKAFSSMTVDVVEDFYTN
jgi:hypothetical protein